MKVFVGCLEAMFLICLGIVALNGGADFVHNEAKIIYLLIVSHPICVGLLLLFFFGIAGGFDEEEEKKQVAADAYLGRMLDQLRIEEQQLVNQLNHDVRSVVDPAIDVQLNVISVNE